MLYPSITHDGSMVLVYMLTFGYIWGILMVNVTIYSIHGSDGRCNGIRSDIMRYDIEILDKGNGSTGKPFLFLASHCSGFPASLEPILGLVIEPQLGSSAPGLKIISKSTAKPGFSHEIPGGSYGFLSIVPCTNPLKLVSG